MLLTTLNHDTMSEHQTSVENDVFTAEKKMLKALIQRAWLDATAGTGRTQRQAIAWLRGNMKERPGVSYHFTFKQVCEYLSLSTTLQSRLQSLVSPQSLRELVKERAASPETPSKTLDSLPAELSVRTGPKKGTKRAA